MLKNTLLRALSSLSDAVNSLRRRPAGNQPGLDALRSLAIILVISGHFAGEYEALSGTHPQWTRFPLFFFGWTGVDLFFVLSGYLIGGQLWRELGKTGAIRVRSFLLRRGMRIWPLYFAAIAAVALLFGGRDPSRILADAFFLSNYAKGIVNGGWSLSTEEQFYLIVPLLLWATARLPSVRWQGLVPIVLLALLPLVRFYSLRGLHMDYARLYEPIHSHSDGLIMGLLIAWVAHAYPRWMKPGPARAVMAVPLLLICLGGAIRTAERNVFAFSSLALIYGGSTVFLLRLRSPGLQRLLSWNGFFLISRLSYGMYLNHLEILPRLMPWLGRTLPRVIAQAGVGCGITYGLSLLVSMAVAFVTFAVIEHPFLRWRDRLLAPHPKPLAAVAAPVVPL